MRLWDPTSGVDGEVAGGLWHSIGLCRFEPGELDPYLEKPLRVPDDEPLWTLDV